jgi:uncharacterized protein (TIGR03435 family)
MYSLLARAFDVSMDQITGPAWLRDVAHNYTLVATMPPNTTKEQFQKMLQNLLVERFHLVFHRETRDFPGYELVVDKGGPKFKEVTPTKDANPDAASDMLLALDAEIDEDDSPSLPPGPSTLIQSSRGGKTRTKYQERTMVEFVSNLGSLIGSSQGKSVLDGHPQPRVVDKTGLTGKYTFILAYNDASMAGPIRELLSARIDPDAENAPAPIAGDPDGGLPNIFVAIQKQLGLRLDKAAALPLEMIVVDSVDKVPTAN